MKTLATSASILILSLGLIGDGHSQWPLGRESGQVPKGNEQATWNLMASGRHQIFVSPHIKGHTFMIDTDTGKVWVMKKDSTSGEFSLQRIPVEEVEGPQPEKPVARKTTPSEKESGK